MWCPFWLNFLMVKNKEIIGELEGRKNDFINFKMTWLN